MTKSTKPRPLSISPAGVGALLKREGLSRSTSSSTAVRGWRSTTTGFKVQTPVRGDAVALVSYVPKTFGGTPEVAEQMILRYAEVLTKAGYRPMRTGYDGSPMDQGPYLSVFAPDLRATLAEAGEFLLLIGGLGNAGDEAVAAARSGDEMAMKAAAERINTGFAHLGGAPLERLRAHG